MGDQEINAHGLSPKRRMLSSVVARPAEEPRSGEKAFAPKIWDLSSGAPIGFYVYQLLDPRTDLPFYVGKGQRERAWQHERAVRSGNLTGNARKVAKIAEIIQRGAAVSVRIVAIYDLESQALDHEFRLVDENPTLTNVAPGGAGGPLSNQARLRRAEARRLLMLRAKERELKEALVQERAKRTDKYLSSARSDRERKQILDWLNGLDDREAARTLTPYTSARIKRDQTMKLIAAAREERKKRRRRPHRKRNKMREELDAMFGSEPAPVIIATQ